MDFVGRSNRLIVSGSQRVNQPGLALPHLQLSTQVVEVLVPTAVTKRYHHAESCVTQNTGSFSDTSSMLFLLSSLCFITRIGHPSEDYRLFTRRNMMNFALQQH